MLIKIIEILHVFIILIYNGVTAIYIFIKNSLLQN
jgi:hypothetical protein